MGSDEVRLKLVQPCPACQQGYTLTLLTCPGCARLHVACDEAGCVYADPCAPEGMCAWPCDVSYTTHSRCPHCSWEGEFRLSTREEAHGAGLDDEAIYEAV